MNKTLNDFINDSEYSFLFEETKEQKEIRESLFNGPFSKPSKQTLGQSMQILRSGE